MPARLIESKPKVAMGSPWWRNTHHGRADRREVAAGETIEQLLAAHPRLTRKVYWRRWSLLRQPCGPTSFTHLRRGVVKLLPTKAWMRRSSKGSERAPRRHLPGGARPGTEDRTRALCQRFRGPQPVTADKDFGELVFRQNQVHAGVVLIRLAGLSAERKKSIVVGAIQQHAPELTGAFAVISALAVRIRRRTE
jgi:hypothetical protein